MTDEFVVKPHKNNATRLSIEALMFDEKHKKQRDLFLQGFAEVLRKNNDKPYSFYKVAGIHGLPEPIYCQHSNILFPTWHRPYVLLLEGLIIEEAERIIKKYHYDDEYKATLEKLRFPYWDWASPSVLNQGIPSIFFDEYVRVCIPDEKGGNKDKKIPNPLRAYTLPVNLGTLELVGDISNPTQRPYDPDGENYPYTPAGFATVRHPDKNYRSNINSVGLDIVTSCSSTFRPGINDVLQVKDWKKFSNTGSRSNPLDKPSLNKKEVNERYYEHFTSIEAVHNKLHLRIGGKSGHMAYTEISGFDPIFFLHHANVDRFVAIWQVCQFHEPDSWMKDETDPPIGENTDLKPFIINNTSRDYWTSKDVRYIKNLGYTYPELEDIDTSNPSKDESEILLNDMLQYYKPVPDSGKDDYKYKLTISVRKNKVGSPFEILAFIDLPIDSPTPHITSPNFAGFISIFAFNSETKCDNCDANPDVLVNDSIDITSCMQRLRLINPNSRRKWEPYQVPNRPLNERITLIPVLMSGRAISIKHAGVEFADCWGIKISESKRQAYNYLGRISL